MKAHKKSLAFITIALLIVMLTVSPAFAATSATSGSLDGYACAGIATVTSAMGKATTTFGTYAGLTALVDYSYLENNNGNLSSHTYRRTASNSATSVSAYYYKPTNTNNITYTSYGVGCIFTVQYINKWTRPLEVLYQ